MSGAGYGQIGPYELRGILGRGGMATVYRAYAPALRREVALKVLTAPENKLDLLRERFRREARTVARLQHPHILPLLDAGEEHGIPYLVMELIEGGALSSRLGRPLPPGEALAIARQIGQALDYAHAQGVVHRDVKPANIFLRGGGQGLRAVLADFGIVKVFGELGPKLTQTGVGIGTPEYTAPEQAVGEPIDGRSDLYSLGVVLYEMLTGRPPYQGGTLDVVNAHVQGFLPDPRGRNPALPPAVSAVLFKALARQPARRYATGAALADALEEAITGVRPAAQPAAGDAPAPTMVLDRTRELLLRTQAVPLSPPTNLDATIVAPRPGAPSSATPGKAPPPVAPAGLPPVPSRPAGEPGWPGAARGTPAPLPPKALPPTPLAGGGPTLPPTVSNQPTETYPPQGLTLPPRMDAAMPPTQIGAASLDATQLAPQAPPPPAPFAPPYQPPAPPPPPPAAPRRGNLGLWVGLGAALVVLLVVIGAGSVYLLRRETNTTPTATIAASAPPTTTAVVAGTPVPGTGATPTIPARAVTATAAAATDPARERVAAGDAALQGGQFTQAVAAYKEALAANPQSVGANRQLGLALWVWNHEPGEVGYLDQATKLDPNDALAWAYLSFSSVDTHQVERAYAAAQRAVAANSQQAEAFAAIANCYVRYPPAPADPQSGKREAREALDRAKALDPNNLWVLWVEHVVLTSEEQYEAALVPLDRMIAERPNWATLYYAKGGTYSALERPGDARTWQERALAIDPEYPYALTELGWMSYYDGDYPRAKDYFNRALKLTDDTNDSAHVGMGYTLAREGDYTNALLHCQRAAGIDQRLPGGFSCLGYLYRVGTRQFEESQAAYRKVIELRPYWEEGHIGFALVQADQRNYAAAEKTLKEGLPRVTKPKEIYYWLGWVLYQEQKYQEAQPNFEKAAQLLPDNAVVQFQLGQNLEQLQRFPEARAAYERALAIDPNYTEARKALDRLTQQGR